MPTPSSASRSPEGGAEGTASTPSSARAAAEIIAVTSRDDFLLEMGEALSGSTAVRPVDSVDTALSEIAGSRKVQLLAVDARDLENLRNDIERVNSQAPHLVTLVFASAEAEKQTAFALKGTNVFAVLPVPIDKRKTAAVLDGAIADANARRPAATPRTSSYGSGDLRFDKSSSITVEAAPADTATYGGPTDSDSGNRKPMMMIGGGIAAVVMLAGVAWYFMSGSSAPPPAAADKKPSVSISTDAANTSEENVVAEPPPIAVDMTTVNGTVDELLEKARLAMRERRYTEPNGDNALLYYRSAVKADPASGEASDGLKRVAAVLNARFDESLAAGRYDEAALALANLKAATPDDPRMKALDGKLATAQINKMLAENNLERAASLVRGAQQSGAVPEAQITRWRSEISRRQEEARQKRLVELAQDRIRDGRLSEGDDSAKAYLEQLRDLGPSAASAQQRVARELGGAFMRKAREAALGNKGPEVDRWLAEAKSIGVSTSELNSFQRDMANAKQRAAAAEAERLAGLARDRIRDSKLVEPANDSAAFYLSALQSADANHPYVTAGSRELSTKLLDRASAASRDGRTAQMDADLNQARRWGADPKDIAAVQQANASRRAAAKPAVANSNNNTNNSGSAETDLQSKLKRVRYTAPEFPERALSQKISGAVTVEFVVSTTGEPIDVRVVSAEPAGTFDRAAIAAVKRWRYAPVVVDNTPREVPARTTIRFNAEAAGQ